jgi:hypothetical protein
MRRVLIGVLSTMVVALSAPTVASAAEYSFDVGCGLTAATPPSHVCEIDDPIGAFFEADEDTGYEVCLEFPDGFFTCTEEEFAQANVFNVNPITTNELGQHLASWWIGEELLGIWDFQVVASPPPPPPPPPPAPVAPPPPPVVVPQVSAACVKARRSVTRLRARIRKASTAKQKAKLRPRLRRAKAAVRRAC